MRLSDRTLSVWQEPPTADKEHQVAGRQCRRRMQQREAGRPLPKPTGTSPQLTSGSQQLPLRRDRHFLAKRIYTVLIRFAFKDKKEHLSTATFPRYSYILNYQQNKS